MSGTSEQTSKWPSTYVPILGFSETQGRDEDNEDSDEEQEQHRNSDDGPHDNNDDDDEDQKRGGSREEEKTAAVNYMESMKRELAAKHRQIKIAQKVGEVFSTN